MKFLQILLNIVVFILGLTVVICLHELGHLIFAKLFNVYCAEYSIGFGPAILDVHKLQNKMAKKKGLKPLYNDESINEETNSENSDLSSALKEIDSKNSESLNTNQDSLDDFKPMDVMVNNEVEDNNNNDIEEKPIEYLVKKKGETNFCIRAIPLGGFVSMAGESGEVDTSAGGKVVPPERCLNSINRAKQVVIMLAGIMMNFILAIFLFFIARLCPYQYSNTASPAVQVYDGPCKEAGLQTGDRINYLYQEYHIDINSDGKVDDNDTIIYYPYSKDELPDQEKISCYLDFKDGKTTGSYNDAIDNCISYCSLDVFKSVNEGLLTLPDGFIKAGIKPEADQTIDNSKYIIKGSYRVIHINYTRGESNKDDWLNKEEGVRIDVDKKDADGNKTENYRMQLLGISATTETARDSFGQAIGYSFADFGNNFVGLFKSIGSIFTAEGWKQVGGIVSIYNVSSQAVSSGSAVTVLRLWGLLSLNVGIFNLLPFPGLDGWQAILTVGEAIARKKIPAKVKGIMNTVGMIVMLLLAGLLIIKDLFFK